MRRAAKFSATRLRAGSLLERRLEALEIRFSAPQPVNFGNEIIGLAEQHLPTEDLDLLVAMGEESAAAKPLEMSDAETKAFEAFQSALEFECREAGMCSLEDFQRLQVLGHSKRGM